jgi:hypothetical protein
MLGQSMSEALVRAQRVDDAVLPSLSLGDEMLLRRNATGR